MDINHDSHIVAYFQFYVDLKNLLMYNDFMYLTEKDLRFEIRQVNATINELATDQAGDITYLHQEIVELKSQISKRSLNK